MGPAKYFNNIIIGQFVLTGVPVKVYIGGRYLTITDADDVEDPTFGFGMDEDGDMQRFDYRNVMQLSVSGNVVDLETYNKGMEAKFGGGGEEKAEEPKDDAKADDEKKDDDDMEERDMMKAGEEDEMEEREDDDMEERGMMKAGDEDEVDEIEKDDDMDEIEKDDDVDEGIIEIDGVKYAPVVSEEEDEEDDEVEEDLDLESVIKELESELEEDIEEGKEKDDDDDDTKLKEEEEFEIDESLFEEDELDEDEELEEVDKSSDIGKGTGRGDTDKSSDIGKGDNKLAEIKSELKEYKEAVRFLKDKLHEVNILNAKLLFTNKLFKEYSLDNGQKLKVVETFDRAQTTREIKLVYSTLAESFKSGPITRKTKNITESASSAVGSTKPSTESKKVITEETQVADRFRKLAGLIK